LQVVSIYVTAWDHTIQEALKKLGVLKIFQDFHSLLVLIYTLSSGLCILMKSRFIFPFGLQISQTGSSNSHGSFSVVHVTTLCLVQISKRFPCQNSVFIS